jgi:hypothetical protein
MGSKFLELQQLDEVMNDFCTNGECMFHKNYLDRFETMISSAIWLIFDHFNKEEVANLISITFNNLNHSYMK